MNLGLRWMWLTFLCLPATWCDDSVLRRWDFTTGTQGWRPTHHVSDFQAANGLLRLTTAGEDAYITVDAARLPAARAHLLRVHLRSTREGRTQLYFSTTDSPDPARREIPSFRVPGDNQWRTHELSLIGVEGWSGALTMLRLDPVNPAVGARVEIDWIELVELAPLYRIDSLAPDRTFIDRGAPFTARVVVRNAGGPVSGEPPLVKLTVEGAALHDPVDQSLPDLRHGDVAAARWSLTAGNDRLCRLSARLCDATGELLASAETAIVLSQPPLGPEMHNGRIGLGVREGREMCFFARAGDQWQLVALARPLARLALGEPFQMRDLHFPRSELNNSLTLYDDSTPHLRVALVFTLSDDIVRCRAELSADATAATLLHFSGPTLLVPGASKRAALFPGVEYLDANEPSSRADIIGRRFAPRSVPPAYWITVPLMAVESDAALVALLWDPMQPWAGEHRLPAALFASPNFIDSQDNHLMQLFVPGGPEGTEKNQRAARRGLPLRELGKIALESRILISPQAKSPLDAVEAWTRQFGLPEVPPPPHDATRTEEICMIGFRDTLYEPGQGWTIHWGLGETPRRNDDFIARLLSYAHRTGDATWLAHTDQTLQQPLIDLLGRLADAAPRLPPQLQTQEPDGTWLYRESEEIKKKTRDYSDGEADSLGRDGTTNVGVCAVAARPLLEHALLWGEPAVVAAASRALAAMSPFRIPAGAQTWEVHKDIPDLNAAGHACACFRMGYQLFGDRRLLDAAVDWARAGLPFIYLWPAPLAPEPTTALFNGIRGRPSKVFVLSGTDCYENPARRVTPYAAIPVFGTSFYVVPWYGHPVQWCGLVWAEAVLELCTEHESELPPDTLRLLRTAVEGVLSSARWQQMDKSPYTGLLPDSWHLETNTAFAAMIGPMRIHDCLLLSEGMSDGRAVHARVLRHKGLTLHLATRARVHGATIDENGARFELQYLAQQPFDCVVSQCPAPTAVRVDGARLRSSAQPPDAGAYTFHQHQHRLAIRLPRADGRRRVEVTWNDP